MTFAAMNIREYIQELAKDDNTYLQRGEVRSVNRDQATCAVVLENGEELPDVRLRPLLENKGYLLVVPEVGSDIVVGFLNKAEAVALIYSAAEEIIYNEGQNKGLVKIEPLIKEINLLKKEINDLKNIIKNWIPSPNDGGVALKTAAAAWFAHPLKNTRLEDLENKQIKH